MKNLSNLILISITFTIFASNLYAAGANKSPYQTQQKNTGAKTVQTPLEKKQQFQQSATDSNGPTKVTMRVQPSPPNKNMK